MAGRKLLIENVHIPGIETFDVYRKNGGYASVEKALKKMTPEEVVEEVKKSGLRGRGGAGFPTGMKWSFLAKPEGVPRYLVCNADESEPGTFKDRYLMEKIPHLLIEGMITSSYALGANVSYIYIRGEFMYILHILEKAIAEARANGMLGKNIMGSGFDLDLVVAPGGGAYICGEETALLESLEGKKGQPRFKPPFPASFGLYGKPTTINNTETFAAVPFVLAMGGEAYLKLGKPNNGGTKIFSVSGDVNRPGNYEIPLGLPFAELLQLAGGMRNGSTLKAVIPGGPSTAVLPAALIENATMDYDGLQKVGSSLGAGSVIIMDDSTCMVSALKRLSYFFYEESCGQCTPCREGTGWVYRVIKRIVDGKGTMDDLDLLTDVSKKISGRTICALGDSAATPVLSFIKHFRPEFEYFIQHGHSMVKAK